MKRKLLSMVLVSLLTISMLTGCGSKEAVSVAVAGEETQEVEGAAEPSGNLVTLKTVSMFGGTDPNAEVYNRINKEFQETNSNITIEDNSQASDEEWKASIAADFSVGNEPDVLQFFTDANANTIIATDKFVTLDEIKAVYPDYAKDTLPAALKSVTNNDGIQRAVPTTGYWEGLYCNKDLFEQYNVVLPSDWDSLVTAITTFKENGIIPIACSLNNVPHYWIDFLMLYTAGQEGYTQVPAKAPEDWVKGLETFKTLRDLGAFPEDTDTVDDAYICQLFKDKKAAMQLDGSWYLGGIKDTQNTVVIPFPGVENQKAEAGTIVGGMSSGFYITKKAWNDPDKRDAAVKFVMAHTCKDAVQRYWNGNGQAACAVDPIDGMSPLAISGLDYSNAATCFLAPTDSRIDPEAYKVIVAGIVKIAMGEMSAENLINDALAINAERAVQ